MDYGYSGGGQVDFAWPRLTPAVKTLMIINVAVFLVNALTQDALRPWLQVSWTEMWEGYGLGLVRLVTYQFAHDFYDPFHLLFNMLILYFFGTFVEEVIGRQRLYTLYLISGVVGGIVQTLMGRIMATDPPMVGASGAMYGILVYAACMAPRKKVLLIVFPIELRWLVGVMVGIGIYMSYIQLATGVGGGVAHGGHIGGALWGFLAYRLPSGSGREWTWVSKLRQWRAERDHQSRAQRQQLLDQLLEKVHREGLQSLTPAERRFLDKASKDMRDR